MGRFSFLLAIASCRSVSALSRSTALGPAEGQVRASFPIRDNGNKKFIGLIAMAGMTLVRWGETE